MAMRNNFQWPCYSDEEIAAVARVLRSNKVNYWAGSEARAFEREFAEFAQCSHAIALSNGTVALDVALKALDIGAGDEVIVTPRTFIASVSSVVAVAATPVFADVDLNSQNIEAATIEPMITPKTKAIIVVHLAGMPADMDPLMALAERYGLAVIEDCAQAHGAQYKGRSVGSIGHVGVWSFCQDKIMTTGGEGGMVTTNSKALWAKMWSYKDHGKCWEAVYDKKHPAGFRWLHQSFGTNYRITEMQAAIGRIQLRRMSSWSVLRRKNAKALDETACRYRSIRLVAVADDCKHAEYKHYFFVNPQQLADGWNRDRIVAEIVSRGVPCYQGSCAEVYLEHAFDNTPWRPKERLPKAKLLGETGFMMLVHPTLTAAEIAQSCEVLGQVLSQASK